MYASMVTAWSLTYGNFNVKAVKVYVLHLSEHQHENYVSKFTSTRRYYLLEQFLKFPYDERILAGKSISSSKPG